MLAEIEIVEHMIHQGFDLFLPTFYPFCLELEVTDIAKRVATNLVPKMPLTYARYFSLQNLVVVLFDKYYQHSTRLGNFSILKNLILPFFKFVINHCLIMKLLWSLDSHGFCYKNFGTSKYEKVPLILAALLWPWQINQSLTAFSLSS